MELKPQDIVVAIDLATAGVEPDFATGKRHSLSSRSIAARLGLSLGAVSQSYQRLRALGLVVPDTRETHPQNRANTSAMSEFFIHGVKYYSQPEVIGVGRGMATGWSAPPMQGKSQMVPPETPYVWFDPTGTVRGEQITPIHECATQLARSNKRAYMILALLDVMRIGKYREQNIAKKLLSDLLILAEDNREL